MAAVLVSVGLQTPAIAQEGSTDGVEAAAGEAPTAPTPGTALTTDEINEAARRIQMNLMSPFCPGQSLRECGSGEARKLREQVREWVIEGRTETWIQDQLMAEYGQVILSAPRFEGFNIVAWIMPVVLLLGGGALIAYFLRRQKDLKLIPADEGPAPPPDYRPSAEIERRLQEELDARSS